VAVNAELTMLYWQVGRRIQTELLKGKRSEYGKQILPSLAEQLTVQYGKGWSRRNLSNMAKCYQCFPDGEIWQTLSAKLSWSHFNLLISIDDPLKRDFYTQLVGCGELANRIGFATFESNDAVHFVHQHPTGYGFVGSIHGAGRVLIGGG
jgi:hypothetical protein